MRIHILVPGTGGRPNGGIRVIYEHANRLAQRGHQVRLHHFTRFPGDSLRSIVKQGIEHIRVLSRSSDFPSWFQFSDDVERCYSMFGKCPKIACDDKIIATYWKTHELLDKKTLELHKCFYFIQGFENWVTSDCTLHRHWRSESINIVVSRWLERMVIKESGSAKFIPNAIDQKKFRVLRKKIRTKTTVLFCSMTSENKSSRDIVEALNALYLSGEIYEILTFGNISPSAYGLIAPYDHHQSPPQSTILDLYNRASIFVAASRSEGWGLTLAEATACGAALVASDAEGHFEFLRPGKSALFFRRGDVCRLAQKIRFLAKRPELQEALVRNAQVDVAPFNWDNASQHLEAILTQSNLEN